MVLSAAEQPLALALDDATLASAKAFMNAARDLREQEYANVHFVVVERVRSQLAPHYEKRDVTTRYEFWSRDNRFFRLDSTVLKSDNPREVPGQRRRIIAQPLGYVVMLALSPDESLAIRDWGDYDAGINHLFGNRHLLAATRFEAIYDIEVITDVLLGKPLGIDVPGDVAKKVGEQSELLAARLLKNDSVLELEYRRTHAPADPTASRRTTSVSLRGDVQHGVVMHYEAQNSDSVGPRWTVQEDKSYDFERYGGYPSQSRRDVKFHQSNRGVQSFEAVLDSIEWNTQTPLGFFSLEAQGLRNVAHGSVWTRRLLVALVGVSLFVAALVIKRRRNHAYA